jgi:hypothetical protein
MPHFPFAVKPRFAVGLALSAALLAPQTAGAAGFGQPTVISGHDVIEGYERPAVAIAPSGRTAVLYDRHLRHGDRDTEQSRLIIARSPGELGPASTVDLGFAPTLLARPDGSFLLCTSTGSARLGLTQGCRIAPPDGGFGPVHVLRTLAPKEQGDVRAVVRPDGSVVLILTRSHRINRVGEYSPTVITVSAMSADGVFSPEQPLDDGASTSTSYLTGDAPVALADGTIVLSTYVGPGSKTRPAIRWMPPDSTRFGPPIILRTEFLGDGPEVTGGSSPFVQFGISTSKYASEYYPQRIQRLLPGGALGPAMTLPGAGADAETSGTALPLPGGDLLGITWFTATRNEDQDCLNPVVGSVSTGPLGTPDAPTTSTRLSPRNQIAINPNAAALADGTVIAVWEDAASTFGATRVQAAIRGPGAARFATAQSLPGFGDQNYGTTLVTGGSTAALLWPATGHGGKTHLVLSALRTTGPYSARAPLPRHPAADCI